MVIEKMMGDWLNTVNIIKWGIILFAVAAVAVIAVAVVIMAKKKKSSKNKTSNTSNENKTTVNQPVEKKEKPVADEKLVFIGKCIRAHITRFDGLYEGVFRYTENPDDADALIEWKERVNTLSDDDEFVNAFNEKFDFSEGADLTAQAVQLMKCIELSGIKRADEAVHTVDTGTAKKYVCIDGQIPPKDTQCKVIKPYWVLDEKVIEQGYIMRKG